MSDTERALLAAIEAHPAEDVPRLVYADWLDENGGDAARAELIRVQCRSACPVCAGTDSVPVDGITARMACHVCADARRHSVALLDAHGERWRKGPVCVAGEGHKRCDKGWTTTADTPEAMTRLYERRCEACNGTGDAGGLLRKFPYTPYQYESDDTGELVRVRWERGFPVVEVPALADCIEGGAPSPWLRAVVTHHRGVEVLPLDRYPVQARESPDKPLARWRWLRDSGDDDIGPSILPPSVFDILTGGILNTPYNWVRWYPTRAAALLALRRALLALRRA